MPNSRWLVALILLAGCNNHGIVPVSGRILLDGLPLANVVVQFEPVDDRSNPGMGSVGKTDSNGHYDLRQIQSDSPGAIMGRHRVTLRSAPRGSSREDAAEAERIPVEFNRESKLVCDVPAGGRRDADFLLSSKPNK